MGKAAPPSRPKGAGSASLDEFSEVLAEDGRRHVAARQTEAADGELLRTLGLENGGKQPAAAAARPRGEDLSELDAMLRELGE